MSNVTRGAIASDLATTCSRLPQDALSVVMLYAKQELPVSYLQRKWVRFCSLFIFDFLLISLFLPFIVVVVIVLLSLFIKFNFS